MEVAGSGGLGGALERRRPQVLCDEVGDALGDLQSASDAQHGAGASEDATSLVEVSPDHDVDAAGLILEVKKVTPLAVEGR